jgi:hypothetical protein
MNRRWTLSLGAGLAVVAIASVAVIPAVASADKEAQRHDHARHDHAAHGLRAELAKIRRATKRYRRVENAIAAGYELGWVNGAGMRIIAGCVSHPTAGAMGYHYFKPELMDDLTVDPLQPEALVYEPKRNGRLRLVAVEWVVRGPQSNPPGWPSGAPPPTVLGMDMHILVPPPGPAFYLMHAWIWKHNPSGMFADWNPKVTCTPEQRVPDDEDDEEDDD